MELYKNPLTLVRALGIKRGDIVSLVGGGGKTTTMYHVADELVKSGLKVIVTTTTHIFPPDESYPCLLTRDINELKEALKENSLIVLADRIGKVKLEGIDPLWVKDLIKIADVILIEADGSRNLPFKAPDDHEPVVPPSSTIVIPVVGTDAVNKPLTEEWVHRPHKVSEITGMRSGELITPVIIAKALLHPMGGMKGVPEGADFIPLINKADSRDEQNIAMEISRCLWDGGVKKTIITSHRRDETFIKPCYRDKYVSAVILAAGGSSRMGRPKQELKIGDKTLADIVIENIHNSIADEIILVTQPGLPLIDESMYPEIKKVVNMEWETGQSSSMKAGLEVVDPESDAAMFFMADQPMVNTDIINNLILNFFENDKPVIAPRYNGKNGSPVLFNRGLFDELKTVEGDKGGRDLLKSHPVESVDIDSPLAGMDADTPEEYERLKEMINLQ